MISAKEAYKKSKEVKKKRATENIDLSNEFLEKYFNKIILETTDRGEFCAGVPIPVNYMKVNCDYIKTRLKEAGYHNIKFYSNSFYVEWN